MNLKIVDTPCDGCVYNFKNRRCVMTPISNMEGNCLSCLAKGTCLYWNPMELRGKQEG